MDTGIFRLLTRQQVYIEGVKNWFAIDLKRYLKLLADEIAAFLAKLNVKSLGDLNKQQLNGLIARVDKRSNEILSQYGTEFLQELRRFTRVTMTMQRSAYAIVKPAIDMSKLSISSVWNAAKDRIVPAFGKTVKNTAADLINSARDRIRSRINSGYADSEPVADTVQAVTNLDPAADPSTLKTVGNTLAQFGATALQHAAQTASDFTGPEVFDCYQWVSVIDSRTSPICRERDGNIYRNGAGPVPPAHPRCRSHIIPVACGDSGKVPTYYNWLLQQSTGFLRDALGPRFANKVDNGTVTAADVPDVLAYPALSLDEYELKAKFLTE